MPKFTTTFHAVWRKGRIHQDEDGRLAVFRTPAAAQFYVTKHNVRGAKIKPFEYPDIEKAPPRAVG